MDRINEQSAAARRAMQDPLDKVLRAQMQLQSTIEEPLDKVAGYQEAMQRALQGPVGAFAQQQEQMQRTLAEPIERMMRHQAAIARALDAPYRAILANQERLVALAQAAAAAATVDMSDPAVWEDGSAGGTWIAAFVSALRSAPLSVEQLEALLSHLGFLLSLVVTGIGLEDGLGDSLEVVGLVSMLVTACAILCFWIRKTR